MKVQVRVEVSPTVHVEHFISTLELEEGEYICGVDKSRVYDCYSVYIAKPISNALLTSAKDEAYNRAFIDFFGDSRMRPESHWVDPDVRASYVARAEREIALAEERRYGR